jgi:hypothetical protein
VAYNIDLGIVVIMKQLKSLGKMLLNREEMKSITHADKLIRNTLGVSSSSFVQPIPLWTRSEKEWTVL